MEVHQTQAFFFLYKSVVSYSVQWWMTGGLDTPDVWQPFSRVMHHISRSVRLFSSSVQALMVHDAVPRHKAQDIIWKPVSTCLHFAWPLEYQGDFPPGKSVCISMQS